MFWSILSRSHGTKSNNSYYCLYPPQHKIARAERAAAVARAEVMPGDGQAKVDAIAERLRRRRKIAWQPPWLSLQHSHAASSESNSESTSADPKAKFEPAPSPTSASAPVAAAAATAAAHGIGTSSWEGSLWATAYQRDTVHLRQARAPCYTWRLLPLRVFVLGTLLPSRRAAAESLTAHLAPRALKAHGQRRIAFKRLKRFITDVSLPLARLRFAAASRLALEVGRRAVEHSFARRRAARAFLKGRADVSLGAAAATC